jgi:hypothetical protein
MTFRISICDIVLQTAMVAFLQWLAGPAWAWTAFFERAGFVVPLALVLLALVRWAMEQEKA